MTDREVHILEAAMTLFVRYGVKRTGMNDIAQEARLSRQTLYNAFPNKDAVLQATIRLLADRVVRDIEKGLEKAGTFTGQLDVLFLHIAIEHFDFLQTSPNAEDIIAGVNATSQDELEAGAQRNIEIIEKVLEPYKANIETNDLSVSQLADFIQRSATAAKYNAKSRKHLLELLATLRASVISIAGPN